MAGRNTLLGLIALGCLVAGDAAAVSMEASLVNRAIATATSSIEAYLSQETVAETGIQFREIGRATGMDAEWTEPYQAIDHLPNFVDMNSGQDYVLIQELYREGSTTPEDELPAGVAYTSVVTLTMGALPDNPDTEAELQDEILFLIMGVSDDQTATPPHPIYTTEQIEFVTDHPTDTPFDEAAYDPRGEGAMFYYLGFVLSAGETVTFRYDVTEQADGGTPVFFSKATYDYTQVPESGTALLMGLGLAGLAYTGSAGRRRQ
jgi:hypothetical protein